MNTKIAFAAVALTALLAGPAFAGGDDAMGVDQRYETQIRHQAPRTIYVEMRKSEPVAVTSPSTSEINRRDQSGNR